MNGHHHRYPPPGLLSAVLLQHQNQHHHHPFIQSRPAPVAPSPFAYPPTPHYGYQQTSVRGPQRPLPRLVTPPASRAVLPPKTYDYVGLYMERPSDQRMWGITLEMVGNKCLKVATIRAPHDVLLDNVRLLASSREAPKGIPTHNGLTAFEQAWKFAKRHMATLGSDVWFYEPPLLEGDIILTINGKTVTSFGGSLETVVCYVSQQRRMALVLLRDQTPGVARQRQFCPLHHRAKPRCLFQNPTTAPRGTGVPPVAKIYSGASSSSYKKTSHEVVRKRHFNQLFRDKDGKDLEFVDSQDPDEVVFEWLYEFKKEEYGKDFLPPATSGWLEDRKKKWRKSYTVYPHPSEQHCLSTPASGFRNPLFKDESGKRLVFIEDQFSSNTETWEPLVGLGGVGSEGFLLKQPEQDFSSWLSRRKRTWRQSYTPREVQDVVSDDEDDGETAVPHDFWNTSQGFASFEEWRLASLADWKKSYSWNRTKRRKIQQECEEVVHFEDDMMRWLKVRKNQWRLARRKRQRERLSVQESNQPDADTSSVSNENETPSQDNVKPSTVRQVSGEMAHFDALLEEQEARRTKVRSTFDLSFIFDISLGVPDDVIAQCLSYLHPSDHGQLLCINRKTSVGLKSREDMWRSLCPNHWTLPRRPRKPWHFFYISKMRLEEETSRKRSDEVLNKVSTTLLKGDHLQKIEKIVEKAVKGFGFDVNYTSGVICERNSMLNLATIHGRIKTVKWLVETKKADKETSDRGSFTPLLNAAWAGDRPLVRYLLSRGCNRNKIGTGHYTKPLAHPDFKGLSAEGWARKNGHVEVANLIRIGL